MKVVAGRRSPRWALMQRFEIPDRHDPSKVYLRRLRVFQTPLLSVYVHWIFLPDTDRHPHDHPWRFASLILRGGYVEEAHTTPLRTGVAGTLRRWERWTLHRMPLEWAHKIASVDPGTVTLVIVGRRRKQWGFWTQQGWVAWPDYDDGQAGPDPLNS